MDTQANHVTQAERQKIWDEGLKGDTAAVETQRALAGPATEQEPATQLPVQATGETQQAGEAQAERFPGVSQEVRDYMSGLQAQVEQLTGRVRGTEAHIGGIKSTLKQQREAAATARQAGGDAPTDQQIKAATQTGGAAMQKLKEQYPEFGDSLEAVIAEELAAVRAAKQEPRDEGGQQAEAAATPEQLADARRDAYIEGKGFPGWKEKVKQPDFVGWFKRQPAEIQMLGYSNDPDHSVRLLELQKQEASGTGRARQLEDFAGVSALNQNSRTGGFQESRGVENMTPAQYWKHLNDIDQAKQRG